uniref:Proprotein convertase subtilisin/kexin type 4 (inferred by orthology to a human protein) n=1 Tax=Strongyloides venezuelensis TaxID=75913 RepID=A0A0K0F694_STRVS
MYKDEDKVRKEGRPILNNATNINNIRIFGKLSITSIFVIFLTLYSNIICGSIFVAASFTQDSTVKHIYSKIYKNEFAVEIVGGSKNPSKAEKLAIKHNLVNLGPIIDGSDYYLFKNPSLRQRSRRKGRSLNTATLSREDDVMWMEQQVSKKRVKRGYNSQSIPDISPKLRLLSKKGSLNMFDDSDDEMEVPKSLDPNDPLWNDMWYLHRSDNKPEFKDHNVKEAWALGYTGNGVVVTILDDGVEYEHPDIKPNYDPKASYDVNDRDPDPTPRYEISDENRHGTRCAGEVAAVYNNSFCITGVAYNAKIGGIRMLDGEVTDAVEAKSLSYNTQHIDIYSASWGPDDDGKTVDGPGKLTREAFENGIKNGRGGLGSIFIWASGNGGKDYDSCNCDGYTNSIYTLSISSASENGYIPWYSEACSSTLATTYSSGNSDERMIVTTDLHHSCTSGHTGTSASAPIAAGIVALTLEANPRLTWRDIQHIVVQTSKPDGLLSDDWVTNGAKRNVSHSFGYGLLDAGAMVKKATKWKTVPRQRRCKITYPARYKTIPPEKRIVLLQHTSACANTENNVKYLEHVQAIISLTAPRRGAIQVFLTSPRGTRSKLLQKRNKDSSRVGFREWAFMTTHSWGELSEGTWSLEIENGGFDEAELQRWDLVFYGTAEEVGEFGGNDGKKPLGSHVTLRSADSMKKFTNLSSSTNFYITQIILSILNFILIRRIV